MSELKSVFGFRARLQIRNLDFPIERTLRINIIEKTASARGTMGRNRIPLAVLFPSSIARFFPSPQPPYDTKRSLRGSAEKRFKRTK